MIKYLSLGAIAIVAIAIFANTINSNQEVDKTQLMVEKVNSKKDPNRPNLQQRIEGRYKHEWDMAHDPNTGTVPRERLLEAKRYTERLLRQKGSIPNVTWEERGPNNVSGRTRSILIDAADPTHNTLFSGGVAGGIWRSTDGGDSWTQTDDFFDNMAIGDIAQDPNDPNIIYFGTGEGYGNGDAVRGLGIWKSTDGGLTFDQLPFTDDNPSFYFVNSMLCLDDNGQTVVLAGNNTSGVQRSTDGGQTWTRIFDTQRTVSDMTVASNGDVYIGVNGQGIFKSVDHGASFAQVHSQGGGRIELNAAPSDSDVVYALFQGALPTIRRTIDAGATWDEVPNPEWFDQSCTNSSEDWTRGQDFYDLTVAVDPNNSDRVFIGGVDLFGTQDAGQNWTQISSWIPICGRPFSHADQHALVFVPGSSDELYNGNDGGVFKITNATADQPDFEFKGNGYNITQFYSCDIHPDEGVDYFLGGTQDNGTQRFVGPGLLNTTSATGGDGGFCHIDQDNPLIQITSFTRNNYSVSTDGGITFRGGPGNNSGRFINPTDYDDETKVLYGASSDGQTFRWNNPVTGNNTDIVDVDNLTGTISAVRCSPNVSDRVYFASNSNVFVVDDASMSDPMVGEMIYDGTGGFISSIEIEQGNEDHIVITISSFGEESVFESTNATAASPVWTNIEGNLPDMPIRWASFNPNSPDQLLVATELGVWSTDDINGASTDWAPTNANLANVRVDMIKFRTSDGVMLAGTHGRGMFSTNAFVNELFVTKSVSSLEANELDILEYTVDIFNNLESTITGVTVTDILDPGVTFIDGSLTCGTISGSTITITEAVMNPGDRIICSFQVRVNSGNFTSVLFTDDIESGDENWTIDNLEGPLTWDVTSRNPRSGDSTWISRNAGNENNTQFLILEEQNVTSRNQLIFWHNYITEEGFDGGFVEISTNNGATWEDLGDNFIQNGYNGVLGSSTNNFIAGRDAFTGDNGGYEQSIIDLSAYEGMSALIRFVFGEDDNTRGEGWYIDDVELISEFSIFNEACLTTDQGDDICSSVLTSIFECEVDCFTCDDGIQNGDEEGIDCGGSCPTNCFACDDGIQNGDETGVDCGGRDCLPCDCTDEEVTYDNTTIPDGTLLRVNRMINIIDMVDIPLGTVFLYAGEEINVDSDFTIEIGTVVTMDIDDCDDTDLSVQPEQETKEK